MRSKAPRFTAGRLPLVRSALPFRARALPLPGGLSLSRVSLLLPPHLQPRPIILQHMKESQQIHNIALYFVDKNVIVTTQRDFSIVLCSKTGIGTISICLGPLFQMIVSKLDVVRYSASCREIFHIQSGHRSAVPPTAGYRAYKPYLALTSESASSALLTLPSEICRSEISSSR